MEPVCKSLKNFCFLSVFKTNYLNIQTFVGGASYGAATVRLGPTMVRTGGSGALAKKVYKVRSILYNLTMR